MSENALTNNDDLKHVLDEETGELVEITDERRQISVRIHERIQGSVMVSAILLQIARDEKIYLAFGLGSFQEYVNTMLPFSKRYAYKLLNVADEFSPILPKVSSMTLSNGEVPNEIQELGSLGISKLYNLTRLPEADYSEVFKKRKVKLADGTELDLREIEESSSREFDRQVSEIRREYQKRISNLEEQNRKYKGEYQHAKVELEKNQDRLDRINELESQYGPKAVRVEDIEHNISVATGHLRKASKYIFQNDLEDDDPDTLKQEINNFLRLMHTIQEGLWDRYEWLKDITQMELPAWRLKDDPRIDPDSDDFEPDSTLEEL